MVTRGLDTIGGGWLAKGCGGMRAPAPVRDVLLALASRRRQRRALAALDDRLLDDVGVSRTQAEVEAARPFWS